MQEGAQARATLDQKLIVSTILKCEKTSQLSGMRGNWKAQDFELFAAYDLSMSSSKASSSQTHCAKQMPLATTDAEAAVWAQLSIFGKADKRGS